MHLAAAGNTEIPAYLVLVVKGYNVSLANKNTWLATKDQCRFVADGPLELLGLVALAEHRGTSWPASDEEIQLFLDRFAGG